MTDKQKDLAIITDLKNRLAGPDGVQELTELLRQLNHLQYDEKVVEVDVDALMIYPDASPWVDMAPEWSDTASYRLVIEYTFERDANRLQDAEEIDTILFVDVENGELTGGF